MPGQLHKKKRQFRPWFFETKQKKVDPSSARKEKQGCTMKKRIALPRSNATLSNKALGGAANKRECRNDKRHGSPALEKSRSLLQAQPLQAQAAAAPSPLKKRRLLRRKENSSWGCHKLIKVW